MLFDKELLQELLHFPIYGKWTYEYIINIEKETPKSSFNYTINIESRNMGGDQPLYYIISIHEENYKIKKFLWEKKRQVVDNNWVYFDATEEMFNMCEEEHRKQADEKEKIRQEENDKLATEVLVRLSALIRSMK